MSFLLSATPKLKDDIELAVCALRDNVVKQIGFSPACKVPCIADLSADSDHHMSINVESNMSEYLTSSFPVSITSDYSCSESEAEHDVNSRDPYGTRHRVNDIIPHELEVIQSTNDSKPDGSSWISSLNDTASTIDDLMPHECSSILDASESERMNNTKEEALKETPVLFMQKSVIDNSYSARNLKKMRDGIVGNSCISDNYADASAEVCTAEMQNSGLHSHGREVETKDLALNNYTFSTGSRSDYRLETSEISQVVRKTVQYLLESVCSTVRNYSCCPVYTAANSKTSRDRTESAVSGTCVLTRNANQLNNKKRSFDLIENSADYYQHTGITGIFKSLAVKREGPELKRPNSRCTSEDYDMKSAQLTCDASTGQYLMSDTIKHRNPYKTSDYVRDVKCPVLYSDSMLSGGVYSDDSDAVFDNPDLVDRQMFPDRCVRKRCYTPCERVDTPKEIQRNHSQRISFFRNDYSKSVHGTRIESIAWDEESLIDKCQASELEYKVDQDKRFRSPHVRLYSEVPPFASSLSDSQLVNSLKDQQYKVNNNKDVWASTADECKLSENNSNVLLEQSSSCKIAISEIANCMNLGVYLQNQQSFEKEIIINEREHSDNSIRNTASVLQNLNSEINKGTFNNKNRRRSSLPLPAVRFLEAVNEHEVTAYSGRCIGQHLEKNDILICR